MFAVKNWLKQQLLIEHFGEQWSDSKEEDHQKEKNYQMQNKRSSIQDKTIKKTKNIIFIIRKWRNRQDKENLLTPTITLKYGL